MKKTILSLVAVIIIYAPFNSYAMDAEPSHLIRAQCVFEHYGRMVHERVQFSIDLKNRRITAGRFYRDASLNIQAVLNPLGSKYNPNTDSTMVVTAYGAEEDVVKHSLTLTIQGNDKTAQLADVVLGDDDTVDAAHVANCVIR